MAKNSKIIYTSYKQQNEMSPDSHNMEALMSNGNFHLVECGYAEVDNKWKSVVTYFPYYRIYLVTEGSATLTLKNCTLELKQGYLYYIPSFQIVSGSCEDCLKHYYLHFSPKRKTNNLLEFYKPVQTVKTIPSDETLFKELLNSFPKKDIASTIRKAGIFQYLLAKFYDDAEGYDNDMLRFDSVLTYIDEHLDSHIDMATLASIANLSEVYFSNLFSKTFGISPIKYINHKKMNMAATMLAENKMYAKEISYSLGYENEMYFFRLFKKTFGMTPGQYKRECNIAFASTENRQPPPKK